MEGNGPQSREVLDMIDNLFDDFFESCKEPSENDDKSETETAKKSSDSPVKKTPTKSVSKGKVPRLRKDSKEDSKDLKDQKDQKDQKDLTEDRLEDLEPSEDANETGTKSTGLAKMSPIKSVSKGKVPRLRKDSKEDTKDLKDTNDQKYLKDPKDSTSVQKKNLPTRRVSRGRLSNDMEDSKDPKMDLTDHKEDSKVPKEDLKDPEKTFKDPNEDPKEDLGDDKKESSEDKDASETVTKSINIPTKTPLKSISLKDSKTENQKAEQEPKTNLSKEKVPIKNVMDVFKQNEKNLINCKSCNANCKDIRKHLTKTRTSIKCEKVYSSAELSALFNGPIVGQTINEPVKTINEPVKTIKEPVKTVKEPVKIIKEPVETIKEPVKTIKEPFKTIKEPVKQDLNKDLKEDPKEKVGPFTKYLIDPLKDLSLSDLEEHSKICSKRVCTKCDQWKESLFSTSKQKKIPTFPRSAHYVSREKDPKLLLEKEIKDPKEDSVTQVKEGNLKDPKDIKDPDVKDPKESTSSQVKTLPTRRVSRGRLSRILEDSKDAKLDSKDPKEDYKVPKDDLKDPEKTVKDPKEDLKDHEKTEKDAKEDLKGKSPKEIYEDLIYSNALKHLKGERKRSTDSKDSKHPKDSKDLKDPKDPKDPKDLEDKNEDVSKISQDPMRRRRSSRDAKNKKDPKDQIADLKNSGDQKASVAPKKCTIVTEEKASNASISKSDVTIAKSKVDQNKAQKVDQIKAQKVGQVKAQKEPSDSSDPELLECTLVLEIVESPSKSSEKVEKSTNSDVEKSVESILDDTIKKVVVTEAEKKTNAHTCEICKKEFAGPKTLKIHERVHSKEKEDRTEESEKKPEIIKRKRKSDSVLQQPEVVLSTENDSSKSASSVDEKRKRKSEIVLQQPEVLLSTGNDSSNSEKSEKKPKIKTPSKKQSNKAVAFSRGGYVKRRRKPKVVVQKTSSTESEV